MNKSFALEFKVSRYDVAILQDFDKYIEKRIEHLKIDGAIKIFEEIYRANHPIVVETHIETWNDPSSYFLHYRLHYRLTAVQARGVVMTPELPVFTFTNHSGEIEWKCPACAIINKIEATYCGELHEHAIGCGRPRDKVRNGNS